MKKPRRVSPLSSQLRIQQRINSLRNLVVAGRSPKEFLEQQESEDIVLTKIWNEFSSVNSRVWPETVRHSDCVENEILSTLSLIGPHSAKSLERLRNSAIAEARGVLFDIVVSDSLLLKGWGQMLTMPHAYLASKLLREPSCIMYDDFVASVFAKGIERFGVKFLRSLANVHHNLTRRSKAVFDECLVLLASNWTNPHCPLWLMSRSAIYTACLGLSTNLAVTPSMVEERLKRCKLKRAPSTPIVGLDLTKKKNINKFVVSQKYFDIIQTREFTNSTDRRYCLVNRPARYRSYCWAKK